MALTARLPLALGLLAVLSGIAQGSYLPPYIEGTPLTARQGSIQGFASDRDIARPKERL